MAYTPWTGQISFPGSVEEPSAVVASVLPNYQIVPLDNSPNQTLDITLVIDGQNRNLRLNLVYNQQAQYWVLTILDATTAQVLLAGLPLITGVYPATNLLAQYSYLGLGSIYLVKVGDTALDYPDDKTLGTSFLLVWGDTVWATL